MAKRIPIRLDKPGITQLLKSDDLAYFLRQVADEVSASAGDGYRVVVDFDRRKSRVISMVLGDDFGREVVTGNLARAVGRKLK